MSLAKGAATSIYDQIFDLLIMVVLIAPGLLGFIVELSVGEWFVATGLTLLAAYAVLLIALRTAFAWTFGLAERLRDNTPLMKRLHRLLEAIRELRQLETNFVTTLFLLAALRYFFATLGLLVVFRAMGSPFDLVEFLCVIQIVRLVQLVAVTPGALGVLEWSWIGLFASLGYDVLTAAEFALAARVANYLGVFVVFLAVALVYLPSSRRRGQDGQ